MGNEKLHEVLREAVIESDDLIVMTGQQRGPKHMQRFNYIDPEEEHDE